MSQLQKALGKIEDLKNQLEANPDAVEQLSDEELDDIVGGWNGVGCKVTNYSCA